MKKTYTHYLLVIFVLISTFSVFSQNNNTPTKLGADVMFTVFEATGGGPKMVLLIQKKDGTEITLEEFDRFSYQDKPGIPEGFKELKLEDGNYTFDNFFQRADFEYHGFIYKGRCVLFFHPITIILDVKFRQIVSKSWYEFSETDLKIESEEYFDNGKISAKGFVEKDGSKTGEWKYYDKEDDHLIMSGTYENDERVGVWKEYDSNGKVKEEVNFSKKSEGNAFEYFSKQQKN
jgi:antitoxin component YwqK of YwqJK toxin-antitoxin module